jgi:hypothetical protein
MKFQTPDTPYVISLDINRIKLPGEMQTQMLKEK